MPKSDPAKNYFKSHGGRAWYDRLLHLIKHGDRAALLEHAGGPPELPHMNPSAMNTQDTKKAFDLREVGGFLPWQFPRAHITLPDIFGAPTCHSQHQHRNYEV